jgi:methylenetetrahydrofolate reductase (NADPH)
MKLHSLWASSNQPTFSFEFFPARSPKALLSQEKIIGDLLSLKPDFVSVTFGAGGSTRQGSRDLVAKFLGLNQTVLAYFACYGLAQSEIAAIMDQYQSLGVENVFAIRGDRPQEPEFQNPAPDALEHASALLDFLSSKYQFCLGAAGYPETHREALSPEKDLEFLKLKVDKGAKFIITQYFYENRTFFDFRNRCRQAGITVPIIAGIMPIYSAKMMSNLAAMCGATVPTSVQAAVAAIAAEDTAALHAFGVDFALKQCKALIQEGVDGLHFYTLNRAISTLEIVEKLRQEGLLLRS